MRFHAASSDPRAAIEEIESAEQICGSARAARPEQAKFVA